MERELSVRTVKRPSAGPSSWRLLAGYWLGEERWSAWSLTLLLALATTAEVAVQLRLNAWNGILFDALETRDTARLLEAATMFALLVVAAVAANTLMLAFRRRLQIGWRRHLTLRLSAAWMDDGRPSQIARLEGGARNADARLAEDVRITCESAVELAQSAFYALLTVIGFMGVLWTLSGTLDLAPIGLPLEIAGHMVVLAGVYAGLGAGMAYLLSRPLVQIADRRQTAEADLRMALAVAQDHAEAIALAHADARERRRYVRLFDAIAGIWARQTAALLRVQMFANAYGNSSTAFAILVNTPRYLGGAVSLGGLTQTAQAFTQVVAAMSWPVTQSAAIAACQASMGRVAALGAALRTAEADTRGGEDKTVRVAADGGPSLVFEDLHLAEPDGRLLVSGFSATIGPGERVLADGDPTAAFALFMATARLWPWGRGRIGLPATPMAFVASAPFLPCETLRALLSFPDPPDGLSDRSMSDALATVGLGRLSGRLDERIDPERALGAGDRQRLDLARVVLRRPPWVIMSAPCDALPPEEALAVVGAVVAALPADATVVLCGGRAVFADLATRRVTVPHATTDRLFERPPPVRRGRFGQRSPAGREDGARRLP